MIDRDDVRCLICKAVGTQVAITMDDCPEIFIRCRSCGNVLYKLPRAGSPKYPDIQVDLDLRKDGGNAFAVIARVRSAMLHAGLDNKVRQQFFDEATASDYQNVLNTCKRWVNANIIS